MFSLNLLYGVGSVTSVESAVPATPAVPDSASPMRKVDCPLLPPICVDSLT